MKIIGSKFWGQDSAICMLDFKNKKIFALNSDRITRIKKDNFDISPIIEDFHNILQGPDIIAGPFNSFDGFDTCFENKGTSYYWLNFQKILRLIKKPKYFSDLTKEKNFLTKIKIFTYLILKPTFFWYFFLWKINMKKYLNGNLNDKNFHYKYCKKHIKKVLKSINKKNIEPIFFDHHSSHSASAYYLSKFFKNGEEAYVFTLDQQGDHTFSSLIKYNDLKKVELSRSATKRVMLDGVPNAVSIGTVYSSFTKALGLRENCDEGKVEALAAYGKPNEDLLDQLRGIICVKNENNSIEFASNTNLFQKTCSSQYLKEQILKTGKEDFAASVQFWLEESVINFLKVSLPKDKKINLCMAGGVVANVILNYKIYEKCNVKNIFICPQMGDEGSALGAAILAAIEKKQDIKWISDYEMPYWGPSYNKDQVLLVLKNNNKKILFEDCESNWTKKAANNIINNKIIAVFQGGMEFGPRALGNRSILANAVDPEMRSKINSSIKRRPKYQPFCPAVLDEDREQLFLNSFLHKFMATAFLMKEEYRKKYPSAAHIDGTARPQFIEKNDNKNLFEILKNVKEKLGHGILINTSFNLHGRSMVMKPQDAIDDFLSCNLDYLYINGYEVKKI